MKRSTSLTSEMSLKTITGWTAFAFIVWWTIEQPTSAAHLAHNIGTFFSTAVAGLSEFLASIPTLVKIIPILAVALVVALIVVHRVTQSVRRRWDAPTVTSLLRRLTRFSALFAGQRRPYVGKEWQGETSTTDTSGRHYAGAIADGSGNRTAWSAAYGVVSVVFGCFAATFWNNVAATGPRLLIWLTCALSLAVLASLYMCFASLGNWWPARLLPGVAAPAAQASIARERPEEASGLASPDPTEALPPLSGSSGRVAMSGRSAVGDMP
jgi:hypothetical protein